MDKQLNIWLDDLRPCPPGHVLCRWPEEVIALIKQGNVYSIDLDHDLGEGSEYVNPRTGMDVLTWLEEWVYKGNKAPRIRIHTANPVARDRMRFAAYRIRELEIGRAKDKEAQEEA